MARFGLPPLPPPGGGSSIVPRHFQAVKTFFEKNRKKNLQKIVDAPEKTSYLLTMNRKEITVADIIKFLQTIPPETKVRVKKEVQSNWSTTTVYSNVEQFGDGEFNIDYVDGINYWKEGNTIDFGID